MSPRAGSARLFAWAVLGCFVPLASAQVPDFADLSLEQLTHYEVTTLGRKNATLLDTPGPADVLSGEDIRRSGAITLADALRLAPGVQVSRIDAATHAISIRGFNDATSSKVLTLLDGRSVYNQLLSGTNWALLDVMLEDVSRIEVQRGPGGALWGANAVNGVINIVSKNAQSTVGSLVSAAAGNELKSTFSVRQGVAFSPAMAARVYAKLQRHDDYGADPANGTQGWDSRLAGARFDWNRAGGGGLSLVGEFRELRMDSQTELPSLLPPYAVIRPERRHDEGVDFSARWTQPLTGDGQLSILGAVGRGRADQYVFGERHTTADIDLQATLHPGRYHEVIGGLTHRTTRDHVRDSPYLSYDETSRRTQFSGAFVQDEITLRPRRLFLTGGVKFERNSFTGWETQPSLRLLWHPAPRQSLWAAASESARTPSRAERGVRYFAATIPPGSEQPLPLELVAIGGSNFHSERVRTYEAGHRFDAGEVLSLQTSLFYSKYEDLRGLTPRFGLPDPTEFPPHFDYYLTATNSLAGYTSGGEISAQWRPRPHFSLSGSVASLRTHLHEIRPGLLPDPSVAGIEGNSPREEYKLRLYWQPAQRWDLDLTARHSGALAESDLPAYMGLDARVAYKPASAWTVELIGRDLLEPEHAEIAASFLATTARSIRRSVYLRVTFSR